MVVEVTMLLVLVALQDMNQLQSLFSAKPWQQGPVATVKFLFKARAARAARMRRSGHHEPATQQQQQQRRQAKEVVKAEHSPSVVEPENGLSHIYVDCAQLKRGHDVSSDCSSVSEPAGGQQQQHGQQEQQCTANMA
jgi:hypothetical protein